MQFLTFLTQRLSFCSTSVPKVQVSSILKENKSIWRGRFEPGVPDRQSSILTNRPPRIRCKRMVWFKYSIENPNPIKKLTINPNPNQYFQCLTLISAVSAPYHYNQGSNKKLLCVRITTYPRAVWDMETGPNLVFVSSVIADLPGHSTKDFKFLYNTSIM